MPISRLRKALASLDPVQLRLIETDWDGWSHTAQRPPESDWATWLFLGGRGAGKTRAGAEWLTRQAVRRARLALVGPTLHDVREVMIEGPSGLRAIAPWGRRPVYEISRRRLVWPNGAVAHAFSAEDPESLRGPQFHAGWADEFCAWKRPGEALAMLRLGMRLGGDPRLVITTTPKPMPALTRLMAEPTTASTHAPTRMNARNLSRGFLAGLEALYGGTRLETQEMNGLILSAGEALWTQALLDRCRGGTPRAFRKVVVGLDPTTTAEGDSCGIVVVGLAEGKAWVLADESVRGKRPRDWAHAVARTVARHEADWVIAETNQGGQMVEDLLRVAKCGARIKPVFATRSKRARAEPVALLYDQGRVIHCGYFEKLEEELMGLGIGTGEASPDRADALIWAVSHLLLNTRDSPSIRSL